MYPGQKHGGWTGQTGQIYSVERGMKDVGGIKMRKDNFTKVRDYEVWVTQGHRNWTICSE